MTRELQDFVRHLRRSLDLTPTLALGLRLLQAATLERQWDRELERLRTSQQEILAALAPAEQETFLRAQLRDRLTSFPRGLARIVRFAKDGDADTLVTSLREHLRDFAGAIGERMRDESALGHLDALAEPVETLRRLVRVPIDDEDPRDLYRAFRLVFEQLAPARDDVQREALEREFQAFTTGIVPTTRCRVHKVASKTLRLETDYDRRVNWAMECNGIPIVHAVRITNEGEEPRDDLTLELHLGPDVSDPVTCPLGQIPPGGTYSVERPDLKLRGQRLRDVREREPATLYLEVRDPDHVLLREELDVDLLAYHEWDPQALWELLASFVLPNAPSVQRILSQARLVLERATGDPSFTGYQTHSRQRVRAMAQAIYETLQELDVTYVNPPASFEPTGQKVRLPHEVLRYRMATCIDLTCLLAACLEQIGLNPLVVHVEGHAFPGCWLVDDWFPQPVHDDHGTLRKLIDVEEILVFDSSTVAQRPHQTFEQAIDETRNHLANADNLRHVLDVRAARLDRILPLPIIEEDLDDHEGRTVSDPGDVPAIDQAVTPARTPIAEPATDAARVANETSARPPERVQRWKEKLLDLTLRNQLLNYRDRRTACLPIECPDLAELEDRLSNGESFQFAPRIEFDEKDPRVQELLSSRGADEIYREQRQALLRRGHLLTTLTENDLATRLINLGRTARSHLEESGTSPLYLALGMLHWAEDEAFREHHLAPLLLVPIEFERANARSPWTLRRSEDEPRLNETLLEKLRLDFGFEFPELRELPLDDAGVDVDAILRVFREAIARTPKWEVLPEANLAFFHFTKFLMWRDLDRHTEDLMRSDLVRHLAEGREASSEHEFLDPRDLDDTTDPASNFLVLNADSSQQLAVEEAARGSSFVLQGPPGTGKSQTIANIIARQLADGKRVLFVAEKRAALDVVASRLRRVGLGEYCLELHGNRTRKKDVAQHLAESLERHTPTLAVDDSLSKAIADDRRTLNDYVRRLHEVSRIGTSPFVGQARLTHLRDVPTLDVELADVLAIDRERRAELEDLVQRLRAAANALDDVAAHPFAACRFPRWTPLLAREIQSALEDLRQGSSRLEEHALRAARWLDVQELLTLGELDATSTLLGLHYDTPPATGELLQHPQYHLILLEVIERGAEHARRLKSLGERWDSSLLEIDLELLIGDWRSHGRRFAPLRWFLLRKHYPSLRARMRAERLPGHPQILEDLLEARSLNELSAKVLEREPLLRKTFEIAWDGMFGDWEALRSHMGWASSWLTAMERLERVAADPYLRRKNPPPELPDALRESLEQVRAQLDLAVLKLGIDERAAFGTTSVRSTPRTVRERVEHWLASLAELRPWSLYSSAEMVLEEAGLTAAGEAIRSRRIAPDALPAAFERTLLEQWIERLESEAPAFSGIEHSRIVERYAGHDQAWIESGGQRVGTKLLAYKPRPGKPSEGSEVHLLHREAKKKRGHLPIRRLLEQLPHLLPRIKPCFLMSPLSIAQYLPPSREPFDLVIFDEASQIPTHDAIGAIARGKQVIVVGDSQQLPPTSFFSITEDEDGNPDDARMQELESILDECTASQVPTLMLEWHYRSRDEALIAFSNHHYYKNRLHTFPGAFATAPHLGLEHRACEGHYERGKRVNQREAEAVVTYVVQALQDPDARKHSIGIVTFNAAQQELIEDLLDAARQRLPEIEPFFLDSAPEPVFVKNLENVQGDERDMILFSITYARDAQGKLSMNFGPLNRDGGERRLNVAITRAREKLLVFATMRSQDVDLSRTKAIGAAHLKSFLRYAEHGTRAFAEAQELGPEWKEQEALVEDIARALRERGHDVEPCVGCSGYRIDLAIRDPQEPGRYALGIELDGVNYRSAPTARDRDRIRRQVLEGLGWNLYRVWSKEWYRGREDEIERIEKALAGAEARSGYGGANAAFDPRMPKATEESAHATIQSAPGSTTPVATDEASVDAEPNDDTSAATEPSPTWQPVQFESHGDAERFFEGQSTVTLQALLVRVVREEGPVHEEEAVRRVAQAFDVPRVIERVRKRVLDLLDTKRVQDAVHRDEPFLWPKDVDPAMYELARPPADGAGTRKPEHVPPQELCNALALVLRSSIASPLEALLRDASRHLGYQRMTNSVREAFEDALRTLVERGFCEQDGETVKLSTSN